MAADAPKMFITRVNIFGMTDPKKQYKHMASPAVQLVGLRAHLEPHSSYLPCRCIPLHHASIQRSAADAAGVSQSRFAHVLSVIVSLIGCAHMQLVIPNTVPCLSEQIFLY